MFPNSSNDKRWFVFECCAKQKSYWSWLTFMSWLELCTVAVSMMRIEGPNFIFIKRLCSWRILQIKKKKAIKVMLPRAAGGLMDWWDHARITRPRKNSEKVPRNGCKHCVELSFHTCNRKSSLSDMFHLKEIFCVVKTRADTPWSHWTCLHVPCVCVWRSLVLSYAQLHTPSGAFFKCGASCLPDTLTSSDCVWSFSLGCCAASTVGE